VCAQGILSVVEQLMQLGALDNLVNVTGESHLPVDRLSKHARQQPVLCGFTPAAQGGGMRQWWAPALHMIS